MSTSFEFGRNSQINNTIDNIVNKELEKKSMFNKSIIESNNENKEKSIL